MLEKKSFIVKNEKYQKSIPKSLTLIKVKEKEVLIYDNIGDKLLKL